MAVDTVENMGFTVKATNSNPQGTTESVVNVNVAVRGFAGPGLPVALYEPGLELLAGNIGVPASIGGNLNGAWGQVIGSVFSFPGSQSNPREFVFFGASDIGSVSYRIDDELSSTETYLQYSFFEVGTLSFNLFGDSGGLNFVLLDEIGDKFRYFIQTGSAALRNVVEAQSFEIENPCYVAGRVSTGQDFIWVGQRDAGFSLIRLLPLGNGRFNTAVLNRAGGQRSLCHILTTDHSDRVGPPVSNDDSYLSDLIAVDYNTQEIVLYGDVGENGSYEELEAIPIATGTTAKLSIVDIFSRGGESMEPRYLVILLADSSVNGDHRIVVVAQNANNREIFQTVYPLGAGIPVAMVDGVFIGDRPADQFARDVVVVTRDSGSYILEFLSGPTTSTPPRLGPPMHFDTGPGAGSAVVAMPSNVMNLVTVNALLIAYPETGLVRQFRPGQGMPE